MGTDLGRQKVAIVTGGAQGIGKAVCRRLLRDGWTLACCDVDTGAGEATEKEYRSLGTIRFVPLDVRNEGSVETATAEVAGWGGDLRALVNNAGISQPHTSPVESLGLDVWNNVIATNLTGMFLMTKHAAPYLRRGGGAVVNIASTRALQSEAHTEAYSASKGGVVALTHALAMSLGPEIRVNCVSPGWIDVRALRGTGRGAGAELTELDHAQHPAGRVGTPDDVAALVAYLAGDEAGFITGQNYVIDGGMTRKMIYVD